VPLLVEPTDGAAVEALGRAAPYVSSLARVRPIEQRSGDERPELVSASPLGAAWLGVDSSDSGTSGERRAAQIAELDRNIARLERLLANPEFVARAPAPVVARERERLADLERERSQLASDT
jgi:valyl-tRNA synthetase